MIQLTILEPLPSGLQVQPQYLRVYIKYVIQQRKPLQQRGINIHVLLGAFFSREEKTNQQSILYIYIHILKNVYMYAGIMHI